MHAHTHEPAVGTVRYTCAAWQGDPYTGHHTGPCHGDGFVDVPSVMTATGEWRKFVMRSGGWEIAAHACNMPGSHDVNPGNRFHQGVHELLFCCGPCHLWHLVHMWDDDPRMRAFVWRSVGVMAVDPVAHEKHLPEFLNWAIGKLTSGQHIIAVHDSEVDRIDIQGVRDGHAEPTNVEYDQAPAPWGAN